MAEFDFTPYSQQWVNLFLIWVGFSTIAGLLARLFLPGNDPVGPLAMTAIAMLGTTLGLFLFGSVVKQTCPTGPCNPISIPGLLCAFAGVLVCLGGYRLIIRTTVREYSSSYDSDEE